MKSLVACLLLCLAAANANAQVQHVLGVWALNTKASKLPPRLFPTGLRSEVRKYQQRDDGFLVVLAVRIYGDGTPEFIQVAARSDGADYPQYQSGPLADFQVRGTPTPFTYSERTADEFTAEVIAKRNGSVTNKGTRRISRDGKTMTLNVVTVMPDGQEIPIVLVFDRVDLR